MKANKINYCFEYFSSDDTSIMVFSMLVVINVYVHEHKKGFRVRELEDRRFITSEGESGRLERVYIISISASLKFHIT